MAWIRSDLMPIREERSTNTIFYGPSKEPLSRQGQRAADKLVRVASALIPEGRSTLFDDFSIADADLTMMLQRLLASGHDLPAKVHDFAQTHWQRPSIHAWVTHPRGPYVPY
jgi:glutathione S-transferase